MYILMYYIKEASEYALLLMILFWLVYVWFEICDRLSSRRILVFTLLCVLAVFAHYGAAFLVVPFGISVLVMALRRKDWRSLRLGIGSFVAAGGLGGGLLLYFFVLPQASNQNSTLFSESAILIEKGNILYDFFYSLMWVFKWSTIDIDRDWEKIWWLIIAAMAVIGLIIVFVAAKTRRTAYRTFLYCNSRRLHDLLRSHEAQPLRLRVVRQPLQYVPVSAVVRADRRVAVRVCDDSAAERQPLYRGKRRADRADGTGACRDRVLSLW